MNLLSFVYTLFYILSPIRVEDKFLDFLIIILRNVYRSHTALLDTMTIIPCIHPLRGLQQVFLDDLEAEDSGVDPYQM
jgi:hypothetical protein